MPLDHCALVGRRDADQPVSLGGTPGRTASLIRGPDGPAQCVQGPQAHWNAWSHEGGLLVAPANSLIEPEPSRLHSRANPCHWIDLPARDLWDPPVTRSQHIRQQVVAIVLAFILAALLGQIEL